MTTTTTQLSSFLTNRIQRIEVSATMAVAAEAERLEPGFAGEASGILPQRHGLVVRVCDDDIAQQARALPAWLSRYLGVKIEQR